MEIKLKDFFVKFFKSLGCEVTDNGETLSISNVPANFEKFSGKKSPYLFSFDKEIPGFEPVNPSHYMIKSMKEFLEGRGETTLLKLDTTFDPKLEIPELIPFRNCEVKNSSTNVRNEIFFRFSFATIFQYLNNRDQIMTNIYIKDGKLFNFDESRSLIEGNKRDIKQTDFNNEYEVAKAELQSLIRPKTQELTVKLKELLNKEISRIQSHYKNQLGEILTQRDTLVKQISESEDEKKLKLEKALTKLNEENSLEGSESEEKMLINHEIKKHGLAIKNKLVNASIIYYPVYLANLILKSGKEGKMVSFEYDSLNKKLSDQFCASCKAKLDEIIICASGHLTCRNCGDRCEVCEGVFCKSCSEKVCDFCNKKICSSCEVVCARCNKTFCVNHAHDVKGSTKKFCRDCMQRCSLCREVLDPSSEYKLNNRVFCLKCYNKEKGKGILEGVFR